MIINTTVIMIEPTIERFEDCVCVYCANREMFDQAMEKSNLDALVKKYQSKRKILFYINNKFKTTIYTDTYKFY